MNCISLRKVYETSVPHLVILLLEEKIAPVPICSLPVTNKIKTIFDSTQIKLLADITVV